MSIRLKIAILLLATIMVGISGCERDDICAAATPTTPLLIIRFYDADEPSEFKEPIDFAVSTALEDGTIDTTAYASDSIAIPLRTQLDLTSFNFILNISNPIDDPELTPPNTDVLNISYTRTEDYISKACGFRITYDMLNRQILPGDDNDGWIQDVIIDETSLTEQTNAHIRIFH